MSIHIDGLDKHYGNICIYRDFSISFTEGIITCILGRSGCGKTTLLNMIGGITKPEGGNLSGFADRRMSYIFQDPRLLPWKTVEGNVEFVISREIPASERKNITGMLLKLVELDAFAYYYPSQLSGGMRQRVSIARAFACKPDIILMDEPFKGLDISLKNTLIQSFSRIWKAEKHTVIYVTHDVDEALLLGEEIMVMGRAPVQILAREKYNVPFEDRHSEDEQFNTLKKKLVKALGPVDPAES